MLKIENLKKYFGGVRAVDNCSFEIKPNTITALIGPNGAGKSTIFNLISGISKTDSGEIIFSAKDGSASGGNSIDITNLSPDRISNLGTSRLFQKTNLFNNLTVRENLLLALDNEDTKFWKNLVGINKVTKEKEKIVRQALKEVNLEQFENTLARELSYGQKRLIELQRAILNPHQFLMLDEPVAGVNPKLRKEIVEALQELKQKGKTILLIEHDMNFTLNVSDWVIVLEKGKVIAEGTPKEIKNNPKVLEAYLGN